MTNLTEMAESTSLIDGWDSWDVIAEEIELTPEQIKRLEDVPSIEDKTFSGVRIVTEASSGRFYVSVIAPNRKAFRLWGDKICETSEEALKYHYAALNYINEFGDFSI